jgi:hypothetical protein
MDPRKLSFLQAVIGTDGANALTKATSARADLEWAILPRVIMSWLEVQSHAGEYAEAVPGVQAVQLSFRKNEDGFTGSINIGSEAYKFKDATLYHVAGSIAVALGASPEHAPELRSPALAKLGKSVDLLVRSRTLRKMAELEKTSWNVKQRRRYQFAPGADKPMTNGEHPVRASSNPAFNKQPVPLSQEQVNARRERYMRGVGLEPDAYGSYPDGFPNADGTNRVAYNGQFDAAHETAHALMTPDDQNLGQYQQWLSERATEPSGYEDDEDDQYQDDLNSYQEGAHHENVANATETYIDRRSGLDPHMFQSKYRSVPKIVGEDDDGVMHEKSGVVRSNPSHDAAWPGVTRGAGRNSNDPKTPFHNDNIRDEAKEHVKAFDAGQRFDVNGNVLHPAGVDAAINARAAITPDRPWRTPAKAGFAERQGAAEHNADVAQRKAELKTTGGAKGVQPKGQAAGAIPPAAPTSAVLTQPKQPSQVGTKVAVNAKPGKGASIAKPTAAPKLPGVKPAAPAKRPTLKVTKAEAGTPLPRLLLDSVQGRALRRLPLFRQPGQDGQDHGLYQRLRAGAGPGLGR